MAVTAMQRLVLAEGNRAPSRLHFLGEPERIALQYGADPDLFHGLIPAYVQVFKNDKEQANQVFQCCQPAWDICKDCDAVTDDEAGDFIYFKKVHRLKGKGEKVLAEYNGLRMMGYYYKTDDNLLFKPTDDPENPIVLRGAECDKLRVLGVARLLIRQL